MKKFIMKLIERQDLSRIEMYDLLSKMPSASETLQGAVIGLLAAKKMAVEEILGARDYFFKYAVPIKYDENVIDIVGTGGDGVGTFNISTIASLVVASCGVPVAKHGGRSSSSRSGSTDVLDQLNLHFDSAPNDIVQSLCDHRFAYLSAPIFNSVLRQYGPLRKSLGFPTIFNILGPLLNPVEPKRMVLGVYHRELVSTVANVLKLLGVKYALVVHSEDGLDELSVSALTHVAEVKEEEIFEYIISPMDAGLSFSPIKNVIGGSAEENAKILIGVVTGEISNAQLDIVLLNSAAGLLVAGRVSNLREGVDVARDAIKSGKTEALLNKLKLREVL